MRRVSLFVHSPVTASLESGIIALEHGEMYSVHEVKIDEELFPLLIEAKPCVLLASVENIMSSASVFNLMKEFKEYRVKHKGASRDPGLRIVIISEGKMPRLNWASLGIYEVIIGPVQPNVLVYKLNRHYHKAITAGEPEPEIQKDLVKEVELKPATSTPEWKVFTNPPVEKTETKVFRNNTEEVEQLSLRVHIADLHPERGEWRKSAVQTEPPPQWNWEFVEEDEQHGKLTWSFRGDEPAYHLEDNTWQFSSEAPKLLRLNSQTQEVHTEFEYHPKAPGHEEARLNVKPALDVRSVRKQIYQKPIWRDEQRVEGPSDGSSAGSDLKLKHLEKAKQNFGERLKEKNDEDAFDAYGKRPRDPSGHELERIDPPAKTKERAQPHYGDAIDRGEQDGNLLPEAKPARVQTNPSPSYGAPPRSRDAELEAVAGQNSRPRALDPDIPLLKEPDLDETFEFDQGIIRPKADKKILSKNTPKAIAARQENLKKAQLHYPELRRLDNESAVIDAAAKRKTSREKAGMQPLSALKTREDSHDPIDYGHLGEKTEQDTRTNFIDENETTELHSAKREQEDSEDSRKKFGGSTSVHSADKRIENEEVKGALSILYEDESKTKENSKTKELATGAKDENGFDPNRWNFRMVKRAEAVSARGMKKIPLAPQKKLSATEKSSLINRIIRFMIELFNRLAR